MAIKITGPLLRSGTNIPLGDLSDVTISSVQDGQIIKYNSTSGDWENGPFNVTGGLTYKGSFNATTGAPSLANALQGDFYVIGTPGTIYGKDWAVGDHLLINEDMGGTITPGKIDKIDNTDQVTSVNGQTGAANIYADDSTLNIDGTGLVLSGTGATSTLNADVGTGANQLVQLDASSRLPAVDGSQLTNLPAAPVTSVNGATGVVNLYADDATLNLAGDGIVVSGTGATSTLDVDSGTTANKIVKLDGSARLPAVDGSQLTNLPSAPVTSVNGATGAVNLYADDATLNLAGDGIVVSGTGATSTLDVDSGTTANKIVKLDGSARLPAVDGSQLTNLPVTSVNGATGAVNLYADDATLNLAGDGIVVSGTGATSTLDVDSGTTANKIVQLDGSARLPAVDGSQLTNLPVTSVNGATGAVNIYADDSVLNIDGTGLVLSGTGATSTLNADVGTGANQLVQLDGSSRLPAVDGSQLTNLPSAPVTSVNGATGAVNIYADDSVLNIDGTGLVLSGTGATSTLNADVGTGANQLVQLDGSSRLPAVDGSQLTNLPVTSVNGATGAVNIYADDTTLNIDGTGLVLSGTGATSTLNADVGTGANQLVQLDGSSRLPAVDGSQLTNVAGTRPTVYSVSTSTTIGADTAIGSGEVERIYIVDSTSAVTMTLPQITGSVGNGYKLNLKRDGANVVTITPNAADNIDGAADGASITLSVDKAAFTLVCDGTNWQII